MNYRLASILACLATLSACTNDGPSSAVPSTSALAAPSVRATTADLDGPNDEIGSDLAHLPSGPAVPYEVEGRPLPTAIVSTYLSGGGQLLQNDEVLSVLDLREFPYPTAMGVVVTDATVSVSATDAGTVHREEALGWLFVDEKTIGELIEGIARIAGLNVAGWTRNDTSSSISGAECVEVTFTNESTPLVWKLSGCSYPEFAGLRAVQVHRAGSYAAADLAPVPAIAGLLARIGSVADAAGLALSGWSLDFTRPDATGSTTVVSFRYTSSHDPTGALSTALSSWTEWPADEDHGLRFRSADDEWEVTATGAAFTQHGRFPE
ncbi:MAG: hypothetical protein ABMA25_15080 [Ilumatobacteraceae bacterium]